MDQIKIGRFIASLRREKGLTQESLGEKLGVTNKTVSRWETGSYMPGVEMLQLLSREFSVSINEILSGERLPQSDYTEKAEENLTELLDRSVFTLREKYEFWRKKWVKDHLALLVCLCLLPIGCWVAGILLLDGNPVVTGIGVLILFVIYCTIRNRMMGYIEGKIYDPLIRKKE